MGKIIEEVLAQDGYLNLKSMPLEKSVLYILCPYGIGDTLYVASLIKSYKEYYQESRKVCLILKESHSMIADWFSAVDGKIVSNDVVEMLNIYMIATQTWKLNNFIYGHFKKTRELQLFPEYFEIADKNMVSRYKQLVYGLPLECELERLAVKNREVTAETEKYQVDKQTIIFMPHAVSCAPMPEVFWETLAGILTKLGYRILTNVKDASETVVKGTEAITGNLEEMLVVCESCLMVIALRSGMCDVLALSEALMVIINTREDYYQEWNVMDAVNRDGIMNLLCNEHHDVMSVTSEILALFDIKIEKEM